MVICQLRRDHESERALRGRADVRKLGACSSATSVWLTSLAPCSYDEVDNIRPLCERLFAAVRKVRLVLMQSCRPSAVGGGPTAIHATDRWLWPLAGGTSDRTTDHGRREQRHSRDGAHRGGTEKGGQDPSNLSQPLCQRIRIRGSALARFSLPFSRCLPIPKTARLAGWLCDTRCLRPRSSASFRTLEPV